MADAHGPVAVPVRVLFVDDEEVVLERLRTNLRQQRSRWVMRVASSGDAALRVLAREPIDVVVSDMRMPGMDGAELFERIIKGWPEVIRIVLSGEASEEQKCRSVRSAHQWLSKPCDRDRLIRAVERAVTTRDLLESGRVRKMVGSASSLPAVPQTYNALIRRLSLDEASAEEIAVIVAEDASIAARMLQMANSAFFCLPREVGDIHEAVMMLGFETIRKIVFVAEVVEALSPATGLEGFSLERFHENALLVSRLAPRFVDDPDQRPQAATAGLVHELGQLLLARDHAESFQQALSACATEGLSLDEAEQREFGVTHAEVGAALLGIWGLPTDIVQAVAHYKAPGRVDSAGVDPLIAVHIAQALVSQERSIRSQSEPDLPPDHGLDMALITRLGLSSSIEVWRGVVRRELGSSEDAADAA